MKRLDLTPEERLARKKKQEADWRAAHPERMRGYQRKWRANNPEAYKAGQKKYKTTHKTNICASGRLYRKWLRENEPGRLKLYERKSALSRYGLTLEMLDNKLVAQDFKCAVCLQPFDFSKPKDMHIDHCHRSGFVRGLIHGDCNRLLGGCKDDVNILLGAIAYLEEYAALEAESLLTVKVQEWYVNFIHKPKKKAGNQARPDGELK